MLIQFSVQNYLSIKNKVALSMLRGGEKEQYLKSAAICGANASGKSNIINAFYFMVNYVLTSHEKQLHKLTGRIPFKFDRQTPGNPSAFEVVFIADGARYAYGFSATDTEITEEYLYHYLNGRKAVIFERTNTNDYHFPTDEDLQKELKDRTTLNKLYLSTAANWNYEKVKPVFEWFASCSIVSRYSPMEAYSLDAAALRDDAYRAAIVSMLQAADFGIQSLFVKETEHKTMSTYEDIEVVYQVRDQDGAFVPYVLNMAEESDGVKYYFLLAQIIKDTLDRGGLLLADEMDAHLHPLLTKHIVSLFDSAEHNPKGAQLIFTSHNTNLINMEFLHSGEVWSAAKDEQTAATKIISQNIRKMHLTFCLTLV